MKDELQVLDMMKVCREICSLGHKLRKQNNLNTRLPLKELQFSGAFLWKDYQDLIKDELNVYYVNPFINKTVNQSWVSIEENGIKVFLNTTIEDSQRISEQKTKEHREEIIKRKSYERIC
jgi:hypothetical protein